jgi:hypothetical protein
MLILLLQKCKDIPIRIANIKLATVRPVTDWLRDFDRFLHKLNVQAIYVINRENNIQVFVVSPVLPFFYL